MQIGYEAGRQNGGSGQLRKLDMRLAGKKAAECAEGGSVEIHKEMEVYSKWFVVASKYVSSNYFCGSFILSGQIFPSRKTILKMNNRTSPNGGREEV